MSSQHFEAIPKSQETLTPIGKLFSRIEDWIAGVIVNFNAEWLYALLMMGLAGSIIATPNSTFLVYVSENHRYSPYLWAFLLIVGAWLLTTWKPRGKPLGAITLMPIILLNVYILSYLSTSSPAVSEGRDWFSIAVIVFDLILWVCSYFGNGVLLRLSAQTKEQDKIIKELRRQLDEKERTAGGVSDAGIPTTAGS